MAGTYCRIFSFLILILSSVPVFAQQKPGGDTFYFYQAQALRLQLAYQNAAFLSADTSLHQVAKLEIDYQQLQGGLHKAQEPYKSRVATLYTEGIAAVGKFKVAGSFRINKVWDDSLANNLNGIFDDATPYYYFATKAGKYERQNYLFNAAALYKATKKWQFGLGLDYQYHWTTGSVDPRPEVKILTYIFKPEIVFHTGKHIVSVQPQWGKGNESSGIIYKNTNYGLSLAYPERIYYLNYGYGYIGMKDQSIYQRDRTYSGLQLNHVWKDKTYSLYTSLSYVYREDKNKRETAVDTRPNLGIFSKWYLRTYSADIFAQKKRNGILQQLGIAAKIQSGRNWDSIFNANNYQYHYQNIALKYNALLRQHNRVRSEIGGGLDYVGMEKKDLLQAHHIQYAYIQPNISAGLYFNPGKKERLSLNIMPSLILPVKNYISVPLTQENIFTQNIVYPDFYYWASTIGKAKIDVNYISDKIIKTTPAGFFGQLEYSRQLQTSDIIYNTAYKPSKNRLDFKFGFRIYL